MLYYQIKPKNLGAHLIEVIIDIPAGESIITAKLPKWIPGSYKIRDYSRNLQAFSATTNGNPLVWYKDNSDTWIIKANGNKVTINYQIYAYDLSVRGAYLDDTRFFFNHCCVCLDITHLSQQKRLIDINTVNNWRIFTALNKENKYYVADSYEQQIDCPMESAEKYLHSEFVLNNIRHEVIFTGVLSDDYDLASITNNLKNICQTEIKLFGNSPLDKYLFMTYLEANQYGGLEHKNSVAQIASPDHMMRKGKQLDDKMIDFMGLCSHEYFHLWNIKRLQPKEFQPYNLYCQQNTEMLWLFEGFTSYYDELFLLRAGIVDSKIFLKRQAQNYTYILNVPGRKLQSLAASSFDAWTKLYQADANSPNNMISYYKKGAFFALYLDLFIRKYSDGNSLDDVMSYLWKNYGKKGIGIDENDVFTLCCQMLPSKKHKLLAQVFITGLHDTDDIKIDTMLMDFGVTVKHKVKQSNKKSHTSNSGLQLATKNGKTKINFLDANSHAASVGVSIGDEILAINKFNSDAINFNQCLNLGKIGEELTLTLSRRGRVFEKTIKLAKPDKNETTFKLTSTTDLGNNWLARWV